jgi:hypothetical protein
MQRYEIFKAIPNLIASKVQKSVNIQTVPLSHCHFATLSIPCVLSKLLYILIYNNCIPIFFSSSLRLAISTPNHLNVAKWQSGEVAYFVFRIINKKSSRSMIK